MVSDKPKREAKPVQKYMPEEPKASTQPKKKATKSASSSAKSGEKKINPFMAFSKHNREAAKKKLPPGLEPKDVMKTVGKILGEMWRAESEANKEMWKAGKVPK